MRQGSRHARRENQARRLRRAISLPDIRLLHGNNPSPLRLKEVISTAVRRKMDLGLPVVELGGQRVVEAILRDQHPAPILRAALEAGATADWQNGFGDTALKMAAETGVADTLSLLVSKGGLRHCKGLANRFDRDKSANAYFSSTLAGACRAGGRHALDWVFDVEDTDPTLTNARGQNALMYFLDKAPAGHPNPSAVIGRMLRHAAEHGVRTTGEAGSAVRALLDACDTQGRSVAWYLARRIHLVGARHPDEAARLRDILGRLHQTHGLNVDVADHQGYTPLLWAAIWGDETLLVQLCDFGANHSVENTHGDTPLNMAADAGYTRLVEILLARGADVHQVNPRTPHKEAVLRAAHNGRWDTVKALVELGASPDAADPTRDHHTLLILAIKAGRRDVVQVLLDAGAEVDMPNSHQATPLMYTVWHYRQCPEIQSDIAGLLTFYGADLGATTRDGRNVIDLIRDQHIGRDYQGVIYAYNLDFIAREKFDNDRDKAEEYVQSSEDYPLLESLHNEIASAPALEKAVDKLVREVEDKKARSISNGYADLLNTAATASMTVAGAGQYYVDTITLSAGSHALALTLMGLGGAAWTATVFSHEKRDEMLTAIRHLRAEIHQRITAPCTAFLRTQWSVTCDAWRDRVSLLREKWRTIDHGLDILARRLRRASPDAPLPILTPEEARNLDSVRALNLRTFTQDVWRLERLQARAVAHEPSMPVELTDDEVRDAIASALARKRAAAGQIPVEPSAEPAMTSDVA